MKSPIEILTEELRYDFFKIKEMEDEKLVMLEDEKGFLRIWIAKEHLESFLRRIKEV